MRVILFGMGRWGKILAENLKKNFTLVKVFNSKSKIEEFDYSSIKWAVVATNNINHYKIVKFLFNKKINVFCEKPLTLSYKESEEIVSIANKKNLKLYVNHIYESKRSKIKILRENLIIRSKNSRKNFEDILFDLFYHDLYLIFNHIDINKFTITNLIINKCSVVFKINSKNKVFNFKYNICSSTKHLINDVNLIDDINYLPEVLKNVFNYKVNFIENNLMALNCNKFIDELISLVRK